MGHDHHHHHSLPPTEGMQNSSRYRETVRVTLIGSVIDLVLGIAKIVVGIVAQSQALVADGIHSLSDLVTDFIVLFAARHSHRGADEEHPYGHGRIETVATVLLGAGLIGVAIGICYDAILRLREPEQILTNGILALTVAVISILAKEGIYHYTMHVANKYRSNMLRANAWHSRTDAISSVIVVVGVGGSMLGYWYLDALAAVGVALMIMKIGWDLAWHSLRELIDTGLESERVEAIRNTILSVDGVRTLHILRTRLMGADALVDVHIQVDPRLRVSEGHQISETVRQRVIRDVDEVSDVMVHIDPEDDETGSPNAGLPLREELLEKLVKAWEDIDAVSHIDDITLHYLEGKVQVDVLLPLSVLKGDPDAKQELARQFAGAAKKVPEVERIKLFYH